MKFDPFLSLTANKCSWTILIERHTETELKCANKPYSYLFRLDETMSGKKNIRRKNRERKLSADENVMHYNTCQLCTLIKQLYDQLFDSNHTLKQNDSFFV